MSSGTSAVTIEFRSTGVPGWTAFGRVAQLITGGHSATENLVEMDIDGLDSGATNRAVSSKTILVTTASCRVRGSSLFDFYPELIGIRTLASARFHTLYRDDIVTSGEDIGGHAEQQGVSVCR
jgi:hypothetical protein